MKLGCNLLAAIDSISKKSYDVSSTSHGIYLGVMGMHCNPLHRSASDTGIILSLLLVVPLVNALSAQLTPFYFLSYTVFDLFPQVC